MLKDGNLRKATFTKPQGSQSGGVQFFFSQFRRGHNTRGLVFTKPEGSQSGGVLYLLSGGVPIRRGFIFANSEGYQSGGVSILPIRKGPIFLPNRRGTILLKDLGKQKKN